MKFSVPQKSIYKRGIKFQLYVIMFESFYRTAKRCLLYKVIVKKGFVLEVRQYYFTTFDIVGFITYTMSAIVKKL